MTIWVPDITSSPRARYLAIVDALASDIAEGKLEQGRKLPTHRDLAYRLGVTVGTVTRAYQEAERRGLVSGEVGRGTYVRPPGFTMRGMSIPEPDAAGGGPIDLSLNFPPSTEAAPVIAAALQSLAGSNSLPRLLEYQPHCGIARHRAAGASFMSRPDFTVDPERVVVTAGGQHAMSVVLGALASPGDWVLTESLTYPGMKALATTMRLNLKGVAIDYEGLIPEAFEQACRQHEPKALYCTPTLQNPTTATMSENRRRRIAQIAQHYNVAIVEDDIYGFLLPEGPPPLTSYAPEISYYIISMSKTSAPGLRIGYIAGPSRAAIADGIRHTIWMAPPLMAEVATMMIESGAAKELACRHRAEGVVRQRLVRQKLAGFDYTATDTAFHGWLNLPAPWNGTDFANEAKARGVLLKPADVFATAQPVPDAIRICTCAARSVADLDRALDVVVDLLRNGPAPALAVV
ncbi:MAG: PLP-dependent aminotransferase family protein [Dongiaceae bacterium]